MMLKGYRTIIFNAGAALVAAIIAALPAIVQVLSMPELAAIIPRAWMPYFGLFVALGNLWLRSITTTPVGKRE